jgi:hypothetical protein
MLYIYFFIFIFIFIYRYKRLLGTTTKDCETPTPISILTPPSQKAINLAPTRVLCKDIPQTNKSIIERTEHESPPENNAQIANLKSESRHLSARAKIAQTEKEPTNYAIV